LLFFEAAGFIPACKLLPLLTLAGINPATTSNNGFSLWILFLQILPGRDTRSYLKKVFLLNLEPKSIF
jgi:hypothetical protein